MKIQRQRANSIGCLGFLLAKTIGIQAMIRSIMLQIN